MWNDLTHGEWDVYHQATGELYRFGQGSLMRIFTVPDHVWRQQQIASSYRASLRRSKASARVRLWQWLWTALCAVRFWYAQRHRQDKIMTNPC
jgi:hypothetical protein